MTRNEFLLNKLIEECSETVRRASLCLTYGSSAKQPHSSDTNEQLLAHEINGVMAVATLLDEEGVVKLPHDPSMLRAGKKDKVRRQLEEYLSGKPSTLPTDSMTSGPGLKLEA